MASDVCTNIARRPSILRYTISTVGANHLLDNPKIKAMQFWSISEACFVFSLSYKTLWVLKKGVHERNNLSMTVLKHFWIWGFYKKNGSRTFPVAGKEGKEWKTDKANKQKMNQMISKTVLIHAGVLLLLVRTGFSVLYYSSMYKPLHQSRRRVRHLPPVGNWIYVNYSNLVCICWIMECRENCNILCC